MARLDGLIDHLRQQTATHALTDRELVEEFLRSRDERCFELLVVRHQALVFGVCWRMLRHRQDAEDAFQAVFMVLARKAGSIRNHKSLASWLYGVSTRVARKALGRRRRDPLQTREALNDVASAAEPSVELREALDRAI